MGLAFAIVCHGLFTLLSVIALGGTIQMISFSYNKRLPRRRKEHMKTLFIQLTLFGIIQFIYFTYYIGT